MICVSLCDLMPLDGIVTLHCVAPPSTDSPPTEQKIRLKFHFEGSSEAYQSVFIAPELHVSFKTELSLC